MTDEDYLKIAIELSKSATYPYGAIIVNSGGIIGRSDSRKIENDTPFCHAELIAIQDAKNKKILCGELKGCTIYSSCEPCPMCMGAILYENINKIVFGARLEDSNKYICEEVMISSEKMAENIKNRKIEIVNILRDDAVDVLRKYKYKGDF